MRICFAKLVLSLKIGIGKLEFMDLLRVLILLVFLGPSMGNELFASEGASHQFCRRRELVRTVRIVKNEKGCRTLYTKSGRDKEIGNGLHFVSCMGFLKNVTKNLESAGWNCRDVSSSNVSLVIEK